MKHSYRLCLWTALLLLVPALVFAQPFGFISETTANPPPPGTGFHGIAQVGNQWFMANFEGGGWHVYDLNFNQVGSTAVVPPIGATRPLCYNSNSGTVFIGDYGAGIIYEVTTAGATLNSFSSGGSGLNALAYNPNNDHVFAVHYSGLVAELTSAGAPVNSFNAGGYSWTGAACDWINDTLLLLTSSNDYVVEYDFGGAVVDTPLNTDAVTGNGQGMAYDANTGIMHVTSQEGNIALWGRDVMTATENTTWGSLKSMY
jgi:hypothetical protein